MASTRKEELQRQLRIIEDEIARLEDRPAEPLGENPVVVFTIRFHIGGTAHTYAALKTNGKWYATDALGGFQARSWEQLLDWIDTEHLGGLQASGLSLCREHELLV